MTIRRKLTLWYIGLLTLIITLFGAVIFGVVRWVMLDAVDTNLSRAAEDVLENIRVIHPGEFGATETTIVFRRLEVLRPPGLFVQVWLTQDENTRIEPSLEQETELEGIRGPLMTTTLYSEKPVFSQTRINGTLMRIYTHPIIDNFQPIGVVQVGAPIDTITTTTDQLLVFMVGALALAILGALLSGIMLTNRVLRPLDEITDAAVKIATTDDLTTRLTWQGPMDELGRLARVFNHMMDRLEHLFTIEQRFVADVSHELRTPLTAIRGNLDIIKRYGMDEASLDAIESETERMSRLVNDLLLLARADYGEISVDLYPLDLDTVVLEVFQEAQVLAKDRDLSVVLDEFEPLRIQGNADRIKQLMLNLISNAIKFTPDGGTVGIALRPRGGWAEIAIRDTGIGMTKEEQERIFDRFYQVDSSRTHSGRRDGAGLGLSIAQWIVEVHKGRINVESEPGKGTTFQVWLPILGKIQIRPLEEISDDARLRLPIIGRARNPLER